MSFHADAYRKDDPDRRFLQSREWRERIRPRQMARQPLCEHCRAMDRAVIADHVDHVIRPKGDRRLQRDPSNLQSLCVTCHGRKSKWERSGSKGSLYIGTRADGWIVEAPGGRVEKIERSLGSADGRPQQP